MFRAQLTNVTARPIIGPPATRAQSNGGNVNVSFVGKTVLVTGGAGGIGRATALAFAQAGATVVISDIAGEAGRHLARSIVDGGGAATFIEADVTSSASVETLVAECVRRHGRLDHAFNNAGIELEAARIADAEEDAFDRIIAVNLKGVFLCLKYQIRQMLAQGSGGAIVNTASVAGLGAAATMPSYAASKHGVVGLTRTAAVEYASKGIRINAVCPGVIRTAMYERAVSADPRRKDVMDRIHPMRRIGEPEEVAAAVMWLCSDQAGFVTGHLMTVDGGFTAQ